MAYAAIVAMVLAGSVGPGSIAQNASESVMQRAYIEVSETSEAAAPSPWRGRQQVAQYDTKLDKSGIDRRLDKGAVDKQLDKAGVDKKLDKSQMDRKLGTDAVDKKLDNSNMDTPPKPKWIPAPSTGG